MTKNVLDGDVRIYAVLVEKIDVVRAEASQHRVRYPLDVFRLAVESKAFARRRINVKAELGGDHDLVAEGRQRLRPILVEDDPLINKSCPRQKIGEPGIGTAVFGEIHHERTHVLR